MKILIPNGTSPRNIGDLAMLTALLGLIRHSLPHAQITIHSTDPHLHKSHDIQAKQTLYSFVAFETPNFSARLSRLASLLAYYLIFKFQLGSYIHPLVDKDPLFQLCQDYQKADLIIFVGGGYLRSKPGITQSLNLLMHLFMVQFAKLFPSRVIVSPISFGPFAYTWQEKLTARILSGANLVATREEISFHSMSKYNPLNLIASSDHALLLNSSFVKSKKTKTIGFTIRHWLSTSKQSDFENQISTAIGVFSKKYGYQIQPIIQVDAKNYGDDDYSTTQRVVQSLSKYPVKVKKIVKITSLKTAQKIYSSIDLLVGMRMHSNILAAVYGTPFIAIAYEHKSEGISKTLGMKKYCLRVQEVSSSRLLTLLNAHKAGRLEIEKTLNKKILAIKNQETARWLNILTSHYAV